MTAEDWRIKINNWSSYQSYKDRKPPWIRFHRSMLDNYEYHAMSAEARSLLPMLWLLASEDEDPTSGLIRFEIDKIAFRLRLSIKTVTESLRENMDSGFIELNKDLTSLVTKPYPNRNETVTPETETETETETEKPLPLSAENQNQDNGKDKEENLNLTPPPSDLKKDETLEFEKFWKPYPTRDGRKVGKKKTRELWNKVKVAERGLLLMAVSNYLDSKIVLNDHTRDPERFLRNDYWRDWVEAPTSKKTQRERYREEVLSGKEE